MRGRHRTDIVQAAAKKHKITDEALFYRAFGSDGDPQQLNVAAQAFQEYVRKKTIPGEVAAFCGQTFLCAHPGCEQPGKASFTRTIIPGNTVQYFCSPDCMRVDVAALAARLSQSNRTEYAYVAPPRPPPSPQSLKVERLSEVANHRVPFVMSAAPQKKASEVKPKVSRRIRKIKTTPAPSLEKPVAVLSAPVIRPDVVAVEEVPQPQAKASASNIIVVYVPILIPVIVEVLVPVVVPVLAPVDARVTISFEMSLSQAPVAQALEPSLSGSVTVPPPPQPPPTATVRKSSKAYLWGPGQWGNPAKKIDRKQPKKGTP